MNVDSEIAAEILQFYYACQKIFYYKNEYVIDFSMIHYLNNIQGVPKKRLPFEVKR